jgi:hypothetical protein
MTNSPTSAWLPAGCDTALLPAGQHGWDAVRFPRFWAHRVLDALGGRAGAVITDGHAMYLLVEPGAADDLQFPAAHGITVLGTGTWVMVPGPDRHDGTPGIDRLRWRTPPTPAGEYLTDVAALQAAIDQALGPRRQAS